MIRSRLLITLASCIAITLVSGGCVSPPSETHERNPSTPEQPATTSTERRCAEAPQDALLLLEGPDCPIVLVFGQAPSEPSEPDASPSEPEPSGRWLALVQLGESGTQTEPLASGPAPLACGPELAGCELGGFVDPERHGPILIFAERGYESEHPVQIHLGIHDAGKLAFIPSWRDESSVVDHTRIGPAFALAPFDCAGELRLLPSARLPEAAGETASARLMMLAGHWSIGDRGQSMPPQIANPSLDGCAALLDPLP